MSQKEKLVSKQKTIYHPYETKKKKANVVSKENRVSFLNMSVSSFLMDANKSKSIIKKIATLYFVN